MNYTPPAHPHYINEANSTASDQIVQPPAGLSVDDVQRNATAIAALLGRPDSSNNPIVAGPSQVPTSPTAGTEFGYHIVYSWCKFHPVS